MHDAAFHDAEIVRWIEWAAAGYFRITLVSPWCSWVLRSSDLVPSPRTLDGGLLPEYGERRAASQTPDGKAPPMSESYN